MRASVGWFPTIVCEAAQPIKFGETLCEALNRGLECHEAFRRDRRFSAALRGFATDTSHAKDFTVKNNSHQCA